MKSDDRVPGLSRKEAVILELLLDNSVNAMYGLELVNNSNNRLKRGTVYVTLDRMEAKGYIASSPEKPRPNVAGLPRRLYRVTDYGQKVFELWQMARELGRMQPGLGGAS